MRICKIWDSEYPWDVRVEKVARSLTDAGHEVHLVARNRDRRRERESLAEAEIHRLKPWRIVGKRLDTATMFPAFFNPRWISAVMRTARSNQAQMLLVRDLPLAPTAIWAARRLHVPVVLACLAVAERRRALPLECSAISGCKSVLFEGKCAPAATRLARSL